MEKCGEGWKQVETGDGLNKDEQGWTRMNKDGQG